MRVENSMKNIYYSVLIQVCMTLLGFISRRVFVNNLDIEYLGINGLLTNVLSMLSLVEGGIGTSIIYNMYKPLAEDDRPAIIALVQLYKKLYMVVAALVFVISLIIYPFLGKIMKDSGNASYITIIYFIFVAKNIVSYLNAHKWSLINSDQKGYILYKYNLRFNIGTYIIKILVLQFTKNYVLYIIIEFIISLIQTMWNGSIVNKQYPYIKTDKKYTVEKAVKTNLVTNVKAIMLHNIGGYIVTGTDNILISALVNVKSVGLYSNYTMVMSQLASILTQVIGGIGASVGNLIATEDSDKSYSIFKVTHFINFWIFSFAVIFLYNLLEPFIDWWLGKGLLLDKMTFIVILLNYYLMGLRNTVLTFKSKAGIFDEDKYFPLIEAVINLGASLILVKYFGLAGIFLGTTVSTLAIPMWTQPKLVFNKIFNLPLREYYKKYSLYAILTIATCAVTTVFCDAIQVNNLFIALIIKGIICLIIPNCIYILIFSKSEEMKYLYAVIKPIINKIKNRIVINV